ncbi:DUF1772 domain-containing protein [Pelagerythrobacter rhizovicinus]|uniref:DUF1772 domain-containing protein n=1 Tax=Pelagerythrobacter rhizovicinus TaxID=2268576 RepID=UPI0013EDF619|nr:DUF1772 domain-containing protein [Pelagerythrobacter rhizovicinus]
MRSAAEHNRSRSKPAFHAQWQPSYKRALPLQSGIGIVPGLAGLVACYVSWDWRWLAGGVVMLANWPLTLLAIALVNKYLMAMQECEAGAESRVMLIQWGRLHNVRSALRAASTVLFLWGFAATS